MRYKISDIFIAYKSSVLSVTFYYKQLAVTCASHGIVWIECGGLLILI